MNIEIKKSKRRAKIWFVVVLLFLVYGGAMLGIGIFRLTDGDNGGASNLISGMFCVAVCGICAYKMCGVVAKYASMEKDLEIIAQQEKFCNELKEIHKKMTDWRHSDGLD